jgi:hypothetical protein
MNRKKFTSILSKRLQKGFGYTVDSSDLRIVPVGFHNTDPTISASLTNKIDSDIKTIPVNSTETLNLNISSSPMGGLFTYELTASDILKWTVSAKVSYNSTDGVNGDFIDVIMEPLFETVYPNNHLQLIELPVSASSYWIKISFTNNDLVSNSLLNIGCREYSKIFKDDIWVVFGASIMEGNVKHKKINTMAKTFYGKDPLIFNRASSSKRVKYIENNIESVLAKIPKSRFIFLHIAGNDISNERPYSRMIQEDRDKINNSFRNILTSMVSSNKVPIAGRVTFRNYVNEPDIMEGCYGGAFPEFGSLPYNENIIDPAIKSITPNFYDFVNNIPLIDLYTITLNNQYAQSNDGVHYGGFGDALFTEIFRDMPMKLIYTNTNPLPIVPIEKALTPMQEAQRDVSIAEIDRLPTSIDRAQISVDFLNTWLLIYDLQEIQIEQDRLNNIIPIQITDYYINFGNAVPGISNWNNFPLINQGETVLFDSYENNSIKKMAITSTFSALDPSRGFLLDNVVPLAIMKESMQLKSWEPSAVFEFRDLDVNKVYDVLLYSSQDNTLGFSTSFVINGITKSTISSGNESVIVEFKNISPNASGKISVITKTSPGSSYGYLNALILRELN